MKAMELNGPEFDWLQCPVARALYACSCGRPHGKWAIFNGMVDDREAIAKVKSSHASSVVAKHQRREREECERRRHSEDSCVAKEYAQQVLEWSRSVHNYKGTMQRFMEAHTIGSATGEDNPDDTFSRIAQGMFEGYVSASRSAVGNYSPDLHGDLTLF